VAKIIDMDDKDTSAIQSVPVIKNNLPPVGYIPVELSCGGKFGVPVKFHIRNFQTGELLDLSLYSKDMLPERVISILNSLIHENINVAEWPDKAITELLVRIYVNFYTPIIPDVPFPWLQEDIEYLKAQGRSSDADRLMKGDWKPMTSVNLTKVTTKKVASDVKPYITITKKRDDGSVFRAKFLSYPQYGDVLTVKKIIEKKYEDTDGKFEDLRKRADLKERYTREGRIDFIPHITDKEYLEWQVYEANKAIFISRVLQAIYLVAYDDVDLSKASIEEKIQYTFNPQFDTNVGKKLDKHYATMDFGLEPNVEIQNPITGTFCTRRFSFRDVDILQALREADVDGYDITYDD